MTHRPSRPLRRNLLRGFLLLVVLALAAINAPALHLLGAEPIHFFPAGGVQAPGRPKLAAVFLSGDMGFHFGMGADVAEAIAERGIPVVGVSSPVVFAAHRTRAEADAVVAGAIRLALARSGAQRVLLMGQSYGADILATTAPDLSPALRARVAAIDLTVPAQDVFFRADPSGLAYLGTPDAKPLRAMRGLDWAPVICVYGLQEHGSLCPALRGTPTRVIGLAGNHYLNRDPARLITTTFAALRAAVPKAGI
ncbi:AcvB/VirJ family lysyl-phosphatidylglycerol hydrolase [Novosphingobium sp. BL-52-GroH]|uniref:AcvB/VirJ family lysyl-phosphatidylglycerol hydrolase n=1 Tax=Novosphingobium sp. BL-52-GroH TaxID=3349877 RepID=UPI00384AD676